MKKLLTVVCLSGLLSVPSVVFAEASWYGSLRAGVKSGATAGVSNAISRFGVRGSSEISEGLTAVYNFEHSIDTASATLTSGRHSYVGLSGGFGTLSVGQMWNASYNSVGSIFYNTWFLGDSETSYRLGHTVSYAVTVENISIQADAIMNNGWGARSTEESHNHTTVAVPAGSPATPARVVAGTSEDKNVDAYELGVRMGLGENGTIAFAHKAHDTPANMKAKQSWVAGQYTIGNLTAYLGVGQTKTTTDNPGGANMVEGKQTDSTTFAGLSGSVADTGVSYAFAMRSKKSKGNDTDGAAVPANKHTPWVMGVWRDLGGGAAVHFEHENPDTAGSKSTSLLALRVDF